MPDIRMDPAEFQHQAIIFFDAFVEAFCSFDGRFVAERYAAPYVALNAEGGLRCFATYEDIATYFQQVLDTYYARGCRSCRYQDLDVVPLGIQSALASVTWELLAEDGAFVTRWRESYNLLRTVDGLRVFASVDHVA
jgi:hypothetical protein